NSKGSMYLVRGFDLHGCMRLRSRDLHEFFEIVAEGGSEALPVNVNYFIYNRGKDGSRRQPNGLIPVTGAYPYFTAYYQSVKNVAPPGKPPQPIRDPKEHLLDLDPIRQAPDSVLTNLKGFTAADREDLKTFQQIASPESPVPQGSGLIP